MINIKLPLRVIPKQRPRVTNRGTYMPQPYLYQREYLRVKFRPFKKLEGEISLDCLFIFKRSKTMSKNKYSMPVPDTDNLIGSIMDAGEGVLYDNDRQITEHCSKKMWGDEDLVFITVKEVSYNK